MNSRPKKPEKKPSEKLQTNDSRRSACSEHNSENCEQIQTSKKSKGVKGKGNNEDARREVESTMPFSADTVSVKGTESHFTRDEANMSVKDHGENERNKGLYWFIYNQVSTLQPGKIVFIFILSSEINFKFICFDTLPNWIISVALEAADNCDRLALSSWGLPEVVLQRYQENKITRMFEWQAECLCTGNVLGEYILNVLLIRLTVHSH